MLLREEVMESSVDQMQMWVSLKMKVVRDMQ